MKGSKGMGYPDNFSVDESCRQIVHYYVRGEGHEMLPKKDKVSILNETWAIQDGYGEPGYVPSQGWDWSGIRDSSDQAMRLMAAAVLKIIAGEG